MRRLVSGRNRSPLATAALVVLAVAFVYAVVSALSGDVWTAVSTDGATRQFRQFNPASLVPVLGTGGALYYARREDPRSVWIISIALLVFSGLFLFSLILVFAPTALAVTVSAVLLTMGRHRKASR